MQKVFEKEGKTKIGKCNHPTPEAYNSWQKVPKKKAKYKIEKKTILYIRSIVPCRKCSKKKVEIR